MRDVSLDLGISIDEGNNTSVAVNYDGLVVEVHESDEQRRQVFGRANGTSIAWQGPAKAYGTGSRPRVAVQGTMVVEVHDTATLFKNGTGLEYQVGFIGRNDFSFSAPQPYAADASDACVALIPGFAVGIETTRADGVLCYRLGGLIAETLSQGILSGWETRRPIPGASGTASAVSASGGVVVVIYENAGRKGTSTIVGTFDRNEIVWGKPQSYDAVARPAIAVTDDGVVVAAGIAVDTQEVVCRTGRLSSASRTIDFPAPARTCNTIIDTRTEDVTSVSLAASQGVVFETLSDRTLKYSGSLIQDRAAWMYDQRELLGAKTLKQIAIPGAHDSTTYVIRNCSTFGKVCNSQTQTLRFIDQLRAGVRYFDIRPMIENGVFETGHFGDIGSVPLGVVSRFQGCGADHLADVLRDVQQFMYAGARELVILKFSHYYDRDAQVMSFNAAQIADLTALVADALAPWLYASDVNPGNPLEGRLADTPLREFIVNRANGAVLPVFDVAGIPDDTPFPPGLHRYRDYDPDAGPVIIVTPPDPRKPPAARELPEEQLSQFRDSDLLVYDNYANRNTLDAVSKDQIAKLKRPQNHNGDLFLFSWTLTQDDSEAETCGTPLVGFLVPSILNLAGVGDTALGRNLVTLMETGVITPENLPNIIYLDHVAGFAADAALWVNRRLSLGDTLYAERRDYLAPGESLVSAGNVVRLTYQADGDLVLYRVSNGARIRSVSGSAGRPAWRAILQDDGTFAVYSEPYVSEFDSGTPGYHASRLVLDDDGTLALFDRNGARVPAARLR